MKSESLALLKDLSRTLAAADGAIFSAECWGCSMRCDEKCGKTCRAWYVMEALDNARYAVLDVLGVFDNA